MRWHFREMTHQDLAALLPLQEQGAVNALSDLFPQAEFPFPTDVIRQRWARELSDPAIAPYVAVDETADLVGFAARRADELLHFGTAVPTWGSGLATWLHDALIATFPKDLSPLRLRVFDENHRARRFYEKLGWAPTGVQTRTSYPPHPTLVEYARSRVV